MPVSGTYTFNMEVDEILEEAFDKVGTEHISGREAKSARRKLNLLLLELQNKEIPISAIDTVTVTVASSVTEYPLSVNVNDVLTTNLKRDSQEIVMNRMSLYEYHQLPVKSQVGRPTQYTTERNIDTVVLKLWPMPENSTDTLEITFFKKIDDITKSAGQNVALNPRYLPSIINILAYEIGKTRDGISAEKLMMLKKDSDDSWEWVRTEDRERTTNVAVPRIRSPLR